MVQTGFGQEQSSMKNFLFFVLFITISSVAKEPPQSDFKWQVGEELFYKVRYAFFTVGTLHFEVLKKDTLRGRNVYHCRMLMKSNTAVPFVPNIEDTYESLIDEEFYSHIFWSFEKQKDHWLVTRYDMDYEREQIHILMEKQFPADTVVVKDSTVAVTQKVQDGLSLLFYARANAKKKAQENVPVFTFFEHRDTFINFSGELDEVKARGKDVDGFYLDGKMKFVGIAGVKDDFKGWFSQDEQSVPLHAKMKAIVGSVRLNLEWWKNWSGDHVLPPPNFEDEESSD